MPPTSSPLIRQSTLVQRQSHWSVLGVLSGSRVCSASELEIDEGGDPLGAEQVNENKSDSEHHPLGYCAVLIAPLPELFRLGFGDELGA